MKKILSLQELSFISPASIIFLILILMHPIHADTINPSDISFTSSSGVRIVTSFSFDELLQPGYGVGFERHPDQTPSATWNLLSSYDISAMTFFGRMGNNSQGAVNDLRLEFYSDMDGNGELLGSFDPATFSANQTQQWDLSSLALSGVNSFSLVMQGREAITSQSVPGQWYEMGFLELAGSLSPDLPSNPIPLPTTAWLMVPFLLGLIGLRTKGIKVQGP